MVNLFGQGFVGSHYSSMFPCLVNERNNLCPKFDHGQILYMISTTDNYNVATNPYIDIDTNLTTLIRVLENCRGKNLIFNFVSSWFVYGSVPAPHKEESLCDPHGFYSITKRTAEQLLTEYCNHYGIPWRILRLANVIGPGDAKVTMKKNVLTYMIRQLRNHKEVELYNRGQQSRDYIDVRDVARAINLIITLGDTGEIYNVGNGVSITLAQVIEYAADCLSARHLIKYLDGDNKCEILLDVTKLMRLGYNPNYEIFHTIDELITESVD
jgi:nucleoside-diphosphate-sugar epimerase